MQNEHVLIRVYIHVKQINVKHPNRTEDTIKELNISALTRYNPVSPIW